MPADAMAITPTVGEDLHSEPNLLPRFQQDAELAGLVGEEKNAKLILLAAVSAKLPKPLNVSVGGASSAGKNHLIGTVARFIPEEDKKTLTGMSPKVLMHSAEDEFQHKAVFIAEYEGVAGADYAIRTMQSEQVIEWEFVESSKDEGIKKKKRTVKGPAAFIQATTRATLHAENETRLVFVEVDESEGQTRAINERQALEAEKRATACPQEVYDRWQELLRGLESRPVRIPFASQLAEHLPKNRIRTRRDFPKLLGLIEASAFLHQHQRNRDEAGNIVAAPEDYLIAKELFEHSYYAGPDSKVRKLVEIAAQQEADFTVADLMEGTGWGHTKTYNLLKRAQEMGCIADGEKWGRYRFLRQHAEAPLSLPAKIRLRAQDFHISARTAQEDIRNSAVPQREVDQFRISEFPSQELVGGTLSGKTENFALEKGRA